MPEDFFAQFFDAYGGGPPVFSFGFGPGGPPRREKGENSVIPYTVTLEDLYNGKVVKMNMEKQVLCTQCKG
jgi:DnaJ family protein A protein 2